MSRSLSRSAPGRPRSAHRHLTLRLIALAAFVAGSGWVIGLLVGPPSAWAASSNGAHLLSDRLSDATLRRFLTWCCWACWAVFAVALAPIVAMPRRRSPASLTVVTAIPNVHADANSYAGPRSGIADRTSVTPGDDTMDAPLAWDERPTDLGRRTEQGSAEARMTIETTDGGTIVGGGRRERVRGHGPEPARPVIGPAPLPAPSAGPSGPEKHEVASPAPAEAGAGPHEPVPPPPAVVRVPLEAAGEPSIDLSTLGSLAVLGDEDDVAELLCSMVVDAAAGRLSAPTAVVLVGFGEGMHGLDGIVAVRDAREALRLVERSARPDGRDTTVVFVGGARRDGAALHDLLTLASPHGAGHVEADDDACEAGTVSGGRPPAGLAVVIAGECPQARWRLELRGASLEESLVRQLGRSSAIAASQAVAASEASTTGPVEISVLGPVRVTGTAVPFERRPKLTELVIYLALHPDGATTDAWATALWPDRRMPLSTLSNRLSETRLSLGYAPDGFAHLRKRGGRYHLGPFVATDWDRFQQLAAGDDPAGWRAALVLVRGRPFEGLREAQWTLLEGVVPAIESAVVELACRLAEHLLSMRDPEGAEWAARRAMLACPWDERLYRLVMRAADAAGNRAGVEAALRQLACVLELGEEPLTAVHPETASLYRSLTSRRAIL